jgi:hypothetical protein
MRPQAAQAYQGMDVDWVMTFANAKAGRVGEVSVFFNAKPHGIGVGMVTGDVSLRRYPQLKQLRAGTPVHLRGAIRKVDALFNDLEITELLLTQPTAAGK